MSIVTVFVSTSAENVGAERRFDKGITIEQLKIKLEPITGIPASTQRLSLYNGEALIGSFEGDDSLMLGAFPIENFMRLHVVDTNPNRIRNQYTDVSLVDKYEMPDEEYSKRYDSVLAFKQRNKFGRFADDVSLASEASFEEEAKDIKVGDRCEVETGDGDGLRRRGLVQFVGLTKFKPGYWVGVQYDEPLGKNDGAVDGERYFTTRPKHGAFVRPNKLRVGDFPEENLEDDDLEEM